MALLFRTTTFPNLNPSLKVCLSICCIALQCNNKATGSAESNDGKADVADVSSDDEHEFTDDNTQSAEAKPPLPPKSIIAKEEENSSRLFTFLSQHFYLSTSSDSQLNL